jgi:raffinose/stachyose/melibiose transport system substrate-binding protein
MKPVIDGFTAQNPGVRVEFSTAPPVAEYIATLQTRILSGTAADVFFIAAENKTNLIENHAVVDLTDEPFMAGVAPFNKQTYSGGGRVYGMSLASWGAGVLFNKELLAKVGATDVPATWDEFLALCTRLKDAGITPYLEPVQGMTMDLAAFLGARNAMSGNALDKGIFDGSSSFAATWTEPLTQWSRLWTQGLVTRDVVGLTGDQVRDEFANGRVAMIAAGPWDMQPLRKAAPQLQVDMRPVPALAGGQQFLAGAASPGYAINAKARNPALAKKFLAYLSTPDALALYNKSTSAITTTTNSTPVIDPALQSIVGQVRAGQIYLPQIAWQRHEDVLNVEATAQLQLLVQGKASPAEVAAALDRKLQDSGG